jgi:hypothetical protein
VLGALLGGALADAAGLRAPYVWSGVVQLVITPLFVVSLHRARRAAPG